MEEFKTELCFSHIAFRKDVYFSRHQAPSQPSSGSRQKRDDAKSSSPVGLIIGVTVAIVTILLLVAAVFFYRRRRSR